MDDHCDDCFFVGVDRDRAGAVRDGGEEMSGAQATMLENRYPSRAEQAAREAQEEREAIQAESSDGDKIQAKVRERVDQEKARLSALESIPASHFYGMLLNSILSEEQLQSIEIKPSRKFLGPICEGTLGEIFGPRGIGKSWFKDVIAICLTRGTDLGPFINEHPASVLIVDGEMTLALLKDRRKLMEKVPVALKPLDLISNEHLHTTVGTTVNLANEAWRNAFLEFIKASGDRWDVIIFDNLSSFLPGVKENDQDAWSPINTFLLQLRWLRKAVIFVHHAGKSGDQRGTSGREDALDYVIKLTIPPGYDPDAGCRFDATLTKSRSLVGPEAVPFTFSIVEDKDGSLIWSIQNLKESKKEIVIALLGNGISQKEAGEIAGVNKAYVSRIRAAAIHNKLLDHRGTNFTILGKERYGDFDVDSLVS